MLDHLFKRLDLAASSEKPKGANFLYFFLFQKQQGFPEAMQKKIQLEL